MHISMAVANETH